LLLKIFFFYHFILFDYFTEISRNGENLSLPDNMKVTYPNDDDETINKYKLFYVDLEVTEGKYGGGSFRFQIDLRNEPEYPTRPPKVTMLTKVFFDFYVCLFFVFFVFFLFCFSWFVVGYVLFLLFIYKFLFISFIILFFAPTGVACKCKRLSNLSFIFKS
jgi:hypothetical protein